MGRVNASPPGIKSRAPGLAVSPTIMGTRPGGARSSGPRPAGARSGGARAIGVGSFIPVLAALVWFAMNLLTDALDLGPDVDLATFAGTILVTAFAAVVIDRSSRDDLAVALGATLGYVVSSPFGRAEHHPSLEASIWTGVVSGLLVFGAIVILRRLLDRPARA